MGKYLEALKLIYGDDEKNHEISIRRTDKTDKSKSVSNVSTTLEGNNNFLPESDPESIPFTDHEIAEHKIDIEVHRDDRSFVRQQLIGAYGEERLSRVNVYLEQFNLGAASVSEPHKKTNAGRRRANAWIREKPQSETNDGQ
jgi:hypothetical protein